MPVAGRGGVGSFTSDPRTRLSELLSQAVTGPDGRAALHAPMQGAELTVRVVGEHPPCSVDLAAFVDGRDLVVVVVRLAGLDPTLIRASLVREDGRGVDRPRDARHEVGALDGDGRSAIRGLQPGDYRIRLSYAISYRTSHGGGGSAVPLELEIPAVTISALRRTEVTIDASGLSPGTLRGRVLLDGVVPAARVFLLAEGGRRWGQYVPDAQGGFVAAGLLPGRYRAGLVVGDFQASDGDSMVHPDTFEVRTGEEIERAFAFTRRRLVVRIVNADGSPAAAGLRLGVTGTGSYSDRSTDASGSLVFDPAPAGELQLMMRGDLVADPATVVMPPDKTIHEVTVTLRARGTGR
jgi:hypothetical protein